MSSVEEWEASSEWRLFWWKKKNSYEDFFYSFFFWIVHLNCSSTEGGNLSSKRFHHNTSTPRF